MRQCRRDGQKRFGGILAPTTNINVYNTKHPPPLCRGLGFRPGSNDPCRLLGLEAWPTPRAMLKAKFGGAGKELTWWPLGGAIAVPVAACLADNSGWPSAQCTECNRYSGHASGTAPVAVAAAEQSSSPACPFPPLVHQSQPSAVASGASRLQQRCCHCGPNIPHHHRSRCCHDLPSFAVRLLVNPLTDSPTASIFIITSTAIIITFAPDPESECRPNFHK